MHDLLTPSPPVWLEGIEGDFLPQLINSDGRVIRAVAGPGAGKTTGLKRLVQRLIQGSNISPSRLFVGTFTRVIARDLAEKLGECAESDLSISTIHSLCLRLLRNHPEAQHSYRLRFLLSFEEDGLLYDVEREMQTGGTIHDGRRTLRRIQSDWAERRDLRDAAFWGAMERWLKRHEGMLIGEVVPLVMRALELGDIPSGLYDYVIVDEYQDLTACEQAVIEHLWSEAGSLIVLGDDDQSIYSFRFNHPGGITEFPQRWQRDEVEEAPLPENRRSAKTIVELANAMMAQAGSTKEPMIAVREEPGEAVFVWWNSLHQEVQGLARYVSSRPDETFLILVPRRFIGYRLRAAIGAEAETSFHEQVLEQPIVQERLTAAQLLANPGDQVSTRTWLGFKGGGSDYGPRHNAEAYASLLDSSDLEGIPLLEAIVRGETQPKGSGSTHIRKRAEVFLELAESVPGELRDLVCFLFDPSLAQRIEDDEKRRQAEEDLRLLQDACLSRIGQDDAVSLSNLLTEIRYRVATRMPLIEHERDARVKIMTLHSAKGLEAERVIVAGLADQMIPGIARGLTTREREAETEEQRRLLYVAVTRAKRNLLVSWPKMMNYEDAVKNNVRSRPTFRRGDGVLAVRLSYSSLLPNLTGLRGIVQSPGSSWLRSMGI